MLVPPICKLLTILTSPLAKHCKALLPLVWILKLWADEVPICALFVTQWITPETVPLEKLKHSPLVVLLTAILVFAVKETTLLIAPVAESIVSLLTLLAFNEKSLLVQVPMSVCPPEFWIVNLKLAELLVFVIFNGVEPFDIVKLLVPVKFVAVKLLKLVISLFASTITAFDAETVPAITPDNAAKFKRFPDL